MFSELSGSYSVLFWVLIGSISLLILIMLTFIWVLVRLRRGNERIRRKRSALEEIWQPFILEVLSGNEGPEVLWRMVIQEDTMHFLDVLLRYYRRFEGRERADILTLARPYIPNLVDIFESDIPEERAKAVQLLGVFGLDRYGEQLTGALNDPSLLVAMNAARALANSRYPEYGKYIIEVMPRFEIFSANLRASLLAACGQEIIPLLRKTFASSGQPIIVRRAAGEALLDLADPLAVIMASHFVETEDDPDILIASLQILETHGRLEDKTKIHPLLFWTDAAVRIHAAKAMVSLATQADRAILRDIFDDPDAWISMHATRGLRNIGAKHMLQSMAESEHPRSEFARQYLTGDNP